MTEEEVQDLYEDEVPEVVPYTISGTAKDGEDNPIPNATIYITGDTSDTTVTDESGYWEIMDVVGDVVVGALAEGYTFEPTKLDASEAATDLDFTGTSVPLQLVAHYTFDDENAVDVTGNGWDGTIHGNAEYVEGRLGKAFKGSDMWVELPQDVFGAQNYVSISYWVNIKEWVSFARLFSLMGTQDFEYDSALTFECYENEPWVSYKYLKNDNHFLLLHPDNWYNITVIYAGLESKMYLNGDLVLEEELCYPFSESFGPFEIGGINYGLWGSPQANAYFDEFRIYNYALTEQEVEDLYNIEVPVETYTVSGTVTKGDEPLAGVTITLTGDTEETTTTDSEGKWSVEEVEGEVTVTPSKEDYTFEPEEEVVDGARDDVNFVGTPVVITYAVSGTVTVDEEPLEGVTISFSDETEPVVTDEEGKWSAEGLVGEVKVIPTKEDYTFEPEEDVVTGARDDVNFVGTYVGPYEISGTVLEDGEPLEGVTITLTGDTEETTTTDAEGKWMVEEVEGEVTVTPSKDDYTFEPEDEFVTGARDDVNFVGTYVGPYEISGTVLDTNNNPVKGVAISITADGQDTLTVQTEEDGTWQAKIKGEITITPDMENYTFEPDKREENVVDDTTGLNFTATYVGPYSISGTVLDEDDNPIDDVVIEITGETTLTVDEFGEGGTWQATVTGAVTVTPEHELYTFEPEEEVVTEARDDVDFVGIPVVIPPEKELILHYPFNETDGDTVADATANGFDGTLKGTAGFTANGVIGNALALDGEVDSFLELSREAFKNHEELTIALWIKYYQRIDPPIMENICVVHQFTHNPGFFIKPTFLPRRVG